MSAWVDAIQLVASQRSGDQIAGDIRDFAAPIAAMIIGIIGLKYLFGDQRSLAGFIGFFLLGIVVFTLIKFGDRILDSLGGLFRSWTTSNDPTPIWIMIVAGGLVLAGTVAILFIHEHKNSPPHLETPQPEAEHAHAPAEKPLGTAETANYTEQALAELESLVVPGPTVAGRLHGQIQLAVIVADECGLFNLGSPVTAQHVAKWQVLLDQWPDLAAELRSHPDLLRILEDAPAEEFVRGPELFDFLRSGPRLHPVVRHLLYLTPTPDVAS